MKNINYNYAAFKSTLVAAGVSFTEHETSRGRAISVAAVNGPRNEGDEGHYVVFTFVAGKLESIGVWGRAVAA